MQSKEICMIKWSRLKEDSAKAFPEKVYEEENWEMTLDVEDTCTKMKTYIIGITMEILGE